MVMHDEGTTVVGAVMDDMEDIDLQSLDDETQRFILETHLENIGFMDFLGFELASLSSQHSGFNSLPNVAGRARGGGMGTGSAFVTTLKSFIGMGILTLPFATAKGGLILGPLGLVCVAALSHHCMGLLVKLATRTSTRSFGALASSILGRRAKILVDVCLVLTQYGFAIADIIFIVENVRDVICLETNQSACPGKVAVCAGTLICVLPFTWLRSLQVLTVPVLMSNVVLLCGISWVYYCGFVQLGTHGMAPGIRTFNWAEFPIFFGCAVFSFEGIGLILPIQFAMQQPAHFPKLLQRAMLILGTLFASFGMVGYAAYGLETKDMITFNIPQNKILRSCDSSTVWESSLRIQ